MEKKGLGRGLGALIPGADRLENERTSELDVSSIVFNPFQPRGSINDERFQELVNSVRVHGVLQPIVVRVKNSNEYELVAGERRLRAARTVGLQKIPVVVRDFTDEQSLQVALIENLQREDINAIDAAVAYKRLSDEFGLSQEDIAMGVGKSRSSVANTMRLLQLPVMVTSCIKSGAITEGHARAILSVEDSKQQEQICQRIIDSGLSVREAERLTKEFDKTEKRENVSRETIKPLPDPNLQEVEARLRQIFGTKVSIIKHRDRGRIEIEFYSDDDLERLLLMIADI